MALPLPTSLSQAVVAFTIEADHLFECRMPHSTAESRQRGEPIGGPWLISMPFWANCLQHVDAEGMAVGALSDRELIADRYLRGNNPGLVSWGTGRSTARPSPRPYARRKGPGVIVGLARTPFRTIPSSRTVAATPTAAERAPSRVGPRTPSLAGVRLLRDAGPGPGEPLGCPSESAPRDFGTHRPPQ